MKFLEKLDYLMNRDNLNKSTLSKSCDIPYTTIDGWYKKGYEGLKLTTLRKLANYFETSLDFWANDDNIQESPSNQQCNFKKSFDAKCMVITDEEEQDLIKNYRALSERGKNAVNAVMGASLDFTASKNQEDAG